MTPVLTGFVVVMVLLAVAMVVLIGVLVYKKYNKKRNTSQPKTNSDINNTNDGGSYDNPESVYENPDDNYGFPREDNQRNSYLEVVHSIEDINLHDKKNLSQPETYYNKQTAVNNAHDRGSYHHPDNVYENNDELYGPPYQVTKRNSYLEIVDYNKDGHLRVENNPNQLETFYNKQSEVHNVHDGGRYDHPDSVYQNNDELYGPPYQVTKPNSYMEVVDYNKDGHLRVENNPNPHETCYNKDTYVRQPDYRTSANVMFV